MKFFVEIESICKKYKWNIEMEVYMDWLVDHDNSNNSW